jgi:hypothetical protein
MRSHLTFTVSDGHLLFILFFGFFSFLPVEAEQSYERQFIWFRTSG